VPLVGLWVLPFLGESYSRPDGVVPDVQVDLLHVDTVRGWNARAAGVLVVDAGLRGPTLDMRHGVQGACDGQRRLRIGAVERYITR
jgi:hypothetical protein